MRRAGSCSRGGLRVGIGSIFRCSASLLGGNLLFGDSIIGVLRCHLLAHNHQ